MSSPAELPPPPKPRNRVIERLRAYFFAGILVTGPILLTLYLTWLFIDLIDGAMRWLLPDRYNPATYLHVPGLGLVLGIVALTLIGAATANYVGRIFLLLSERVLARMPVIRGVYGAVKQIFETVLAKQSNTFREAVLVEFPRKGMWTIGFITARTEGEVRELSGPDPVSVYVPTTPNPTSGYLVFVPRSEVVVLSMTVEEAIKMVISTGIVTPPDRRLAAAEEIALQRSGS
ncbi:MAG: DUF502 domain-containing protein [Stellaceae bacterium]